MKKAVKAAFIALIAFCSAGQVQAKTPKSNPSEAPTVSKAVTTAPKTTGWQCVTYARSITGLEIYGDAWTWWGKAQAKYETGFRPKPGAVLVFRPQGKMKLGHVAVVSTMITDRLIQVTHANWSPINGRRGQVEANVNVLDVSEAGDWSKVKVWYGPSNDMGTSTYTTYGFIYNDRFDAKPMLVAQTSEADMPPELRSALTPSSEEVAKREARVNVASASRTAVRVSARKTGQEAAALIEAVTEEKPVAKSAKAPN